jgi:alpha-glucosidase
MPEGKDSGKKPWYKQSVVYQIYPWSFKDTNNDGVGDLRGIIEKLDYLNDGTPQSLGIGAIWLSPIYKSPMKDYGYDISDYYDIDPRFGTMQDFDELVQECRNRNIKIIMDYVTSHTSSEHPWFTQSRSSHDNPKRDWYIWRDPKPDGSPPNNWLSVFGGSAWTLDEFTGQYYLHHFLHEQPDLNWRNPEVREEMKRILDFWMQRGVDGFRVDAISHFIEDSEFRDNPINEEYIEGKHIPYMKYVPKYSVDQPELREVVQLLCDTLNNHEEKFMISETSLRGNDFFEAYRYSSTKLHAPFNFSLIHMKWRASSYRRFIDNFERLLTKDEIPTYVLGNHDQPRIASRLDKLRARTSAMLLLTLRGLPFIYYGEELGLKNVKIPDHKMKDRFVVQSLAAAGAGQTRDPSRTPMPWSSEKNAGFSYVDPWLPLARTYRKHNVEAQMKDQKSMLGLHRKLIHFRNSSQALVEGIYQSISTVSKKLYVYKRETENEKLLIMLNFSKETIHEPLPEDSTYELVCSTYMDYKEGEKMTAQISIRPYEGFLLKQIINKKVKKKPTKLPQQR